jgi:type 1 fimbria pilin
VIKTKPLLPALLILYVIAVQAQRTGNIHFSGAVIESGCWHEPGTIEIICQRKGIAEHHVIADNLVTEIPGHNVTIEPYYLDEDKQLTVLRVIYD